MSGCSGRVAGVAAAAVTETAAAAEAETEAAEAAEPEEEDEAPVAGPQLMATAPHPREEVGAVAAAAAADGSTSLRAA